MSVALSSVNQATARGENVLGRYQLVAPLGQGGMGTIYLAVAAGPADFRKLLVVKELRQDLVANQRLVEMFLDEAKLSARLNHPNVVQTLEAGQEGERYFLSMEFLDGQPFSAIWQSAIESPQVDLPIRLKILCDALAGLHYAHTLTEYDGTNLHIVHRDVSPQNIFVTYDGQVKVVDFGIAKAAVSNAYTTPGVFKGKFAYAAPEQVRGEEVDARTDVFAMGVVLFETLTMQRFSDGAVTRASVASRLDGKEPRAAQFVSKVDARLAAICDRALAVDPAERFGSAEEFRVAIEEHCIQSGWRTEPAAIKQIVTRKFAAQRQAVHQLIDRHIKHGAVEESEIRPVGLGAEVGNDQPTQVADLSRYVNDTNNETVVSEVVSQLASGESRRSSSRKLVVGAVAAVALLGLAAVGTVRWLAAHESADAPATPQASGHVTEKPEVVEASRAKTGLGAGQAQRGVKVAVKPEGAHAAGAGGATKSAVEPKPASHETSAQRSRQSAARSKPRKSPSVRAAAAPAVPAVADPPVPAPAPAPVAPRETVVPKPAGKVAVGADLNGLGRSYQHRAIDTEL